ncbi:MAG: ferrous iron transport protein A [Verrucomicrobia bacterium]|nr:ferrous iron transport protein A [Verrucomicrobiota bacterium]
MKLPANPAVCPLSRVAPGSLVRIKELQAAPELCRRLREMGLREEQQIRILLQDRNVVCRVCNVRLGLSAKLADTIMVEPLQPRKTGEK